MEQHDRLVEICFEFNENELKAFRTTYYAAQPTEQRDQMEQNVFKRNFLRWPFLESSIEERMTSNDIEYTKLVNFLGICKHVIFE